MVWEQSSQTIMTEILCHYTRVVKASPPSPRSRAPLSIEPPPVPTFIAIEAMIRPSSPSPSRPSSEEASQGDLKGMPYDYCKYHGLGNDYLVIEPSRFAAPLTPEQVRALCDRHRGVGGDGVLYGPLPAEENRDNRDGREIREAGEAGVPALRIFNPDGGLAEKSGNGLRIFSRYLWETGHVQASPFEIDTPGGRVRADVLREDGSRIAIAMGHVTFASGAIPMVGPPREVLRETLEAGGRSFTVCAANVGNPHCVVLDETPTPELARSFGPLLEHHSAFPQRTNVQFLSLVDRHTLRIEIWERGAGYTLASGTSSCATAAVACRLGMCESPVTVEMPGGSLEIRVGDDFSVDMEGEVSAVTRGLLSEEFCALTGLRRR